ncbi:hypothetical protein MPLSOD_20042 [Mesorhizobium sp. SOD10]|nr:hypothetical protein MPLSOD_20042 [Mesorhizobium sp. SOD10]
MTITTQDGGPTPGRPETYQKAPNDHRKWGVSSEIVLVPINDRKRNRTLFAKVEERSFVRLPESVRAASWVVVRDGTATDDMQFSVRARAGGAFVTIPRLIMNAKAGEYVRNINGNRLDLRTTNLRLKTGGTGKHTKRHDLALVAQETPAK